MAKKDEQAETQEEARVRVAAEQGIDSPAPGDGTNTGDTNPQPGPEPGVTVLPEGDDSVPAFIQDETGPRVAGEEEAAATVDDRAAEVEQPAKRAEHARKRLDA